MVVKQFIQPIISLSQEGRIMVYLILRVRVTLLALLAFGVACHAAKALGGEAQAVDVLS
jgi:hypothetical protein